MSEIEHGRLGLYGPEHSKCNCMMKLGSKGLNVFAVAGLNMDTAGNYTGHITVQLDLPASAFAKIKTPVYWESAAYGQ